jgi:hypothetical protein
LLSQNVSDAVTFKQIEIKDRQIISFIRKQGQDFAAAARPEQPPPGDIEESRYVEQLRAEKVFLHLSSMFCIDPRNSGCGLTVSN